MAEGRAQQKRRMPRWLDTTFYVIGFALLPFAVYLRLSRGDRYPTLTIAIVAAAVSVIALAFLATRTFRSRDDAS